MLTGSRRNLQIVSEFCPNLISLLELQSVTTTHQMCKVLKTCYNILTRTPANSLYGMNSERYISLMMLSTLWKNIRNHLLNYKRFIFPSFKVDCFKDPINAPSGEIRWKFFHDVHEKDGLLEPSLRKARKLTAKILHPRKLQTRCSNSTCNIS